MSILTVPKKLQKHTVSVTLSSYKHTNKQQHKILQESLEVSILQLVLPQTQDLNYAYRQCIVSWKASQVQ